MSSSEDDYMSDTFLMGCVKEDIRPGLIHSHSDRRNHEIIKKKQGSDEINKSKNPSGKVAESEKRETALNQPIPVDNKGFAMLQKLGFKPGSGLGKSSAGRTEPVPIQLKTDRQGLGRAEAIKESIAKKAAVKKAFLDKLTNVEDYRTHLAEKTAEKRAQLDLRKSQRICKRLDSDLGVEEPDEWWYWPEHECKESDNKYDGDDMEDDNRLDVEHSSRIVDENGEDDEEDCNDNKGEGDEVDDEEEEEEYTVKEKLELLTEYLRKTHYYCIWCAVQYDDDRDLSKECPGPTSEEH